MFDFAWSEIALIGVVALIAIGPKDMPVAIKAVTNAIKKARRMAAEFQTHVDEMVRDADLHEVRNSISEIRNFDIKGTVERAVDPDGSLRSTFASNPLATDPVIHAPAPDAAEELSGDVAVAELTRPEPADILPLPLDPLPSGEGEELAPAFIPPAYAAKPEPPPDFVPPNVARRPPGRA
jgi:sec-independent protein translocase protein TatB